MANEVNIIELYGWPPGEPRSMTVANATAVSAGAIMVYSGGTVQTAIASAGAAGSVNQYPCGILAHDKEASDGATTASIYTNCLVDAVVVSAGNLPVAGLPVALSGPNLVCNLNQTQHLGLSAGSIISGAALLLGIAQEAGTANGRVAVRVKL